MGGRWVGLPATCLPFSILLFAPLGQYQEQHREERSHNESPGKVGSRTQGQNSWWDAACWVTHSQAYAQLSFELGSVGRVGLLSLSRDGVAHSGLLSLSRDSVAHSVLGPPASTSSQDSHPYTCLEARLICESLT